MEYLFITFVFFINLFFSVVFNNEIVLVSLTVVMILLNCGVT